MPQVIKDPCVYYLILNDKIIYIGSTNNLYSRLSYHVEDKNFTSYDYRFVDSDNLQQVEAEEILKHKPVLNKVLPQSTLWSQHKAKAKGVYAKDFKREWKDSDKIVFKGKLYIDFNRLTKYLEVSK